MKNVSYGVAVETVRSILKDENFSNGYYRKCGYFADKRKNFYRFKISDPSGISESAKAKLEMISPRVKLLKHTWWKYGRCVNVDVIKIFK